MESLTQAPGLKWVRRARGSIPYWVADEADVKRGYLPKTVPLAPMADDPVMLHAKCVALQADLLLWRTGFRRDPAKFDGTVLSLLSIYQRHEDSPFRKIKPGTRVPYVYYLTKMEGFIGHRRIGDISGLDILKWHKAWSSDGKHLAASATCRAILESAVRFGVLCRLEGCAALLTILREASKSLPRPIRRDVALTAEQVAAARAAAHAVGRPSRALVYALAFESTLRLWDVIGQWHPMSAPFLSSVIDPASGRKWHGLRWEDIGSDGVIRYTPTKTEDSSGAAMVYDLALAPMALEEIERTPAEARVGPIILSEETGLPYRVKSMQDGWRRDRKQAGIPAKAWARDLRASGATEGRAAGATVDDTQKVMAHASPTTTAKVYDRAAVEAARRFATARIEGRKQSGNTSGNGR